MCFITSTVCTKCRNTVSNLLTNRWLLHEVVGWSLGTLHVLSHQMNMTSPQKVALALIPNVHEVSLLAHKHDQQVCTNKEQVMDHTNNNGLSFSILSNNMELHDLSTYEQRPLGQHKANDRIQCTHLYII